MCSHLLSERTQRGNWKYWKSKLDNVYDSRVAAAAKERADAQKRYNDERDNLLQSNTD